MGKTPRQITLCLALVCLSTAAPPAATAAVNALEEVGHSFQANMRGGTEVAVGDTALSQIRQPASVCLHQRNRFDSKITVTFPNIKWNGLVGGDLSDKVPPPNFSLAVIGPITKRWGYGISLYSKTSWSNSFKSRYALLPGFGPLEASASTTNYAVQPNLGYKVTPKLMVGAGPRIELITLNSSTIYGPGKLEIGPQWSVGAGFSAGVLYKLNDRINLGASYRSPTWMGPVAKGRYLVPGYLPLPARVDGAHYWLPQRIEIGACYTPNEKIKFATEMGYVNWSQSMFGRTRVNGPVSLAFPGQLRDILIVNVGTDYEINRRWGVSTGYSFNTSPVPRDCIVPGFASNTQNMVTYGLRYKHDRWWAGVAHVVGLPNVSRNPGNAAVPLGIDYVSARTRQIMQSLTCGIGFYF